MNNILKLFFLIPFFFKYLSIGKVVMIKNENFEIRLIFCQKFFKQAYIPLEFLNSS